MQSFRAVRRRSRNVLLCSLLAAAASSAPAFAGGDESDGGPTVYTVEGPVQGFTKNGVNTFLGIPYAAPPVGKLRWQPPQPVKRWRNPVDATKFANTCPQVTELGAFAGPSSTNEDCLYLNVFTTGSGHFGQKKPVIVWIHGGGNVDGESNDYDASKLATGGPDGHQTVVVTLNYRMGLFGFLSNPALNSEGHLSGNYGILDIQAVLRWVQRNAAAFGGDPTKVALGGQSAGASDTGANVLSPLATGLFNRAIYESSPTSTFPPASVALTSRYEFCDRSQLPRLGCGGRQMPAQSDPRAHPAIAGYSQREWTLYHRTVCRWNYHSHYTGTGMDDRCLQQNALYGRRGEGRGQFLHQHHPVLLWATSGAPDAGAIYSGDHSGLRRQRGAWRNASCLPSGYGRSSSGPIPTGQFWWHANERARTFRPSHDGPGQMSWSACAQAVGRESSNVRV